MPPRFYIIYAKYLQSVQNRATFATRIFAIKFILKQTLPLYIFLLKLFCVIRGISRGVDCPFKSVFCKHLFFFVHNKCGDKITQL